MEKFVLSLVLQGFRCKMLYFLKVWIVFVGRVWFSLGLQVSCSFGGPPRLVVVFGVKCSSGGPPCLVVVFYSILMES